MRYVFDRDLTVFGRIADILRMRSGDRRVLLLERLDDVARLVQGQRGLGQVRNAIRIGHGQGLYLLHG